MLGKVDIHTRALLSRMCNVRQAYTFHSGIPLHFNLPCKKSVKRGRRIEDRTIVAITRSG